MPANKPQEFIIEIDQNFIKINKSIKIIDYSEENIPYLNFNKYKNFLLPPYFEKESIAIDFKNINFLSLDNNLFRKDIIKQINNELIFDNLPQITVIDNCYGIERDNIYRQTKIYINIHCSNEHNTMELIRISNLLSKNVIVISYNTINSQLLYFSKNILIANNIQEIKKIILEVYKNYNIYYDFYGARSCSQPISLARWWLLTNTYFYSYVGNSELTGDRSNWWIHCRVIDGFLTEFKWSHWAMDLTDDRCLLCALISGIWK